MTSRVPGRFRRFAFRDRHLSPQAAQQVARGAALRVTRRVAERVRGRVVGRGPVDEMGGGPSVEAAILAVVVASLIAFLLAVGRVTAAEAATDQAARAAARIASIARDPAQARTVATEEARRVLGEQDLACESLTVTTGLVTAPATGSAAGDGTAPPDGAAPPGGAPGPAAQVVRATVTCAVRWSDLGLLGAPGTRAVVAEFASPLDIYRERP